MIQTNVIFDTLEYMNDLKKGGIGNTEAEAITKANLKAFNQMIDTKELATKKDLMILKNDLQIFMVKAITTSIMILTGVQTLLHYMR